MSRGLHSSPFGAENSVLLLKFRNNWRWLVVGLALLLAFFTLQDAPWRESWALMQGLGTSAILILLALNLFMLPLMSARWWFILRLLKTRIPLWATSLYRLSGNTASYLTPGPHFGGEPLLVYYLSRYHAMAVPAATTSVVLDRLFELLASVLVLILCLCYLLGNNINDFGGWQSIVGAIALLTLFIVVLGSLCRGGRPFSAILGRFKQLSGCSWTVLSRKGAFFAGVVESEKLAESLFRYRPARLALVNLLSLLHWLAIFMEFWIMASLLGVEISLGQLCGVVLVTKLAFYTPVPAAIGVLELALPHVTAVMGLGGPFGLGLCMIIRFRDLLFTLVGLWLSMRYLMSVEKNRIINDNPAK